LETCYMRLSLLQMTFGKHIERKHCCFFPGAVRFPLLWLFCYTFILIYINSEHSIFSS
uniref:Uncharacterized protein n=1 Tax=Anopheles atroparvus TaxID=41427 RepID=A0A182JKF0_ANOAO